MPVPFDINARNINVLKLRGAADTVSDGNYFRGPKGMQRDSTDFFGGRKTAVYGDVFELTSARGPNIDALKGHKRVLLIWWSDGPGCGVEAPWKTRQFQDSAITISRVPRPRAQWIGEMPTIDVWASNYVYSSKNSPK